MPSGMINAANLSNLQQIINSEIKYRNYLRSQVKRNPRGGLLIGAGQAEGGRCNHCHRGQRVQYIHYSFKLRQLSGQHRVSCHV